jgi:hypothetical protein
MKNGEVQDTIILSRVKGHPHEIKVLYDHDPVDITVDYGILPSLKMQSTGCLYIVGKYNFRFPECTTISWITAFRLRRNLQTGRSYFVLSMYYGHYFVDSFDLNYLSNQRLGYSEGLGSNESV